MRILSVELKNFGSFVNRSMEFQDGINVIWARNGAGKSTIHEFLCAMLYGLHSEECIRWQSWNGDGCLGGKMRFESGGKVYLLERDFLSGKDKGRLYCETDQKELSLENGDLRPLIGYMSENAYRSTFFVSQRGAVIEKGITAEIKNYLGNLSGVGKENIDVNRAVELLEKRQELLENEKRQAQVDLISRQQEIRMKMDYVEQDMDRLKKEEADCIESLSRLSMTRGGREDEGYRRMQEEERRGKHQIRSTVGLILMLGAVLMALAGIYVPPIWAKGACLVSAALLGTADFLYQRKRNQMLEADAELCAVRESQKKLDRRKKTGEQERLRWEIEKVRESMKEKQLDYQNLKESVEELQQNDSRLDSIEEELLAVHGAVQAIKDITRRIYKEAALKIDGFASDIMGEIVGSEYGKLCLNQDMELCVRTKDNTVRLFGDSPGIMEQVCFAARMAVGKTLSGKEEMPILLDDTFSMYDSERLECVFAWLKKSGNQVILFTSRMLEAETAKRLENE